MFGSVSLPRQTQNTLVYILTFTSVSDKKKLLVICLVTLILAQFISLLVYYLQLRPIPEFTRAVPARAILVSSALNACVDTALALSIVILLYRRRSGVPFTKTSSMIDRIMTYTVGSGLLTSAFGLAGLVTYLTMKTNLVYVLLYEMLPKSESRFWTLAVC